MDNDDLFNRIKPDSFSDKEDESKESDDFSKKVKSEFRDAEYEKFINKNTFISTSLIGGNFKLFSNSQSEKLQKLVKWSSDAEINKKNEDIDHGLGPIIPLEELLNFKPENKDDRDYYDELMEKKEKRHRIRLENFLPPEDSMPTKFYYLKNGDVSEVDGMWHPESFSWINPKFFDDEENIFFTLQNKEIIFLSKNELQFLMGKSVNSNKKGDIVEAFFNKSIGFAVFKINGKLNIFRGIDGKNEFGHSSLDFEDHVINIDESHVKRQAIFQSIMERWDRNIGIASRNFDTSKSYFHDFSIEKQVYRVQNITTSLDESLLKTPNKIILKRRGIDENPLKDELHSKLFKSVKRKAQRYLKK